MDAFLWTSYGEAAADLLNDNASWLNVTRFMLYISEVLVADGILVGPPLSVSYASLTCASDISTFCGVREGMVAQCHRAVLVPSGRHR